MTWAQFGYCLKDHWKGIALFVAGVLFMLLVVWWLWGGGGESEKEEQLESNIDQGKGADKVIGNLIGNQETVVNNAANTTNKDLGEFGNSVNRPSNSFDSNRASSRFCRRFPDDPSCQSPR